MIHASNTRRLAALAMASAALVLGTGTVAAVTPIVEASTAHVERPFVDCGSFSTVGVWEISHRLTLFVDQSGIPIRDIEHVEFSGRIVNTTTGASVADSGARTYFDTLAPDGSFLTTYQVQQRHSAYIHSAGRTDFQTGDFRGVDGLDADGIAALCAALGG